ncbi:MAG: hypothetical protein EBT96_12800, partial [Betaproteobacteria bacterium]|nr:hypothetical protein [Betaproteobacteria bacterium]
MTVVVTSFASRAIESDGLTVPVTPASPVTWTYASRRPVHRHLNRGTGARGTAIADLRTGGTVATHQRIRRLQPGPGATRNATEG